MPTLETVAFTCLVPALPLHCVSWSFWMPQEFGTRNSESVSECDMLIYGVAFMLHGLRGRDHAGLKREKSKKMHTEMQKMHREVRK